MATSQASPDKRAWPSSYQPTGRFEREHCSFFSLDDSELLLAARVEESRLLRLYGTLIQRWDRVCTRILVF